MPSHRADTPADAPTALRTRPSAHSAHPPVQRRRDLRTRGPVAAGHGAVAQPRQAHAEGPGGFHQSDGPALPAQRPVPGSRVAAAWAATRPADEPRRPAEESPGRAAEPTRPAEEPRRWVDEPTCLLPVDVETVGALELDPLFIASPSLDVDAGLVDTGHVDTGKIGDGTPAQALRRPRGKARAQAQTTRRAATVVAEREPRRGIATLPQAGIAGALGIATIAVPLAGALGLVPGSRQSTSSAHTAAAAAFTPLTPSPVPLVATPTLTALGDRRLLPQEAPVAEIPTALAARQVRVTASGRASRSTARSVLPGCDGKVPAWHGIQNGRLPASMLCTLWDPKRQLRSDAAVAIAKLNVAYTKRFGHPMCFNDAYRSLTQQYRIKALRGGYAARPGTSEHGWGLAADLCDGVDEGAGSATYSWLRMHAPDYGWQNPTWARPGGSGPYEPWHWEYMPGEQGQSKGD